MPSVKIFALTSSGASPVGTIDASLIARHSGTVREVIATMPAQDSYELTIYGVAPAAARWIIDKIATHSGNSKLYLRVADLPLQQGIAIEEAIRAMRIEPAQPHVEGHILGYVSHNIVNANEMLTLHRAYSGITDSRIYKALIHHLAYNMIGGEIGLAKIDELHEAAQQYPALVTAVEERLKELQVRKAQAERSKAAQAEAKARSMRGKSWRKQMEGAKRGGEDHKAEGD